MKWLKVDKVAVVPGYLQIGSMVPASLSIYDRENGRCVHLGAILLWQPTETEAREFAEEIASAYNSKGEQMTNVRDEEYVNIDRIARVCHEVNKAYCQIIGDNSQLPWEQAPEWQKDSARNGVTQMLKNPSTTPEQSHESWLDQKKREGWKYGPVKDPVKKEHPCFVPYGELPADQRGKDLLFGTVVRAMME